MSRTGHVGSACRGVHVYRDHAQFRVGEHWGVSDPVVDLEVVTVVGAGYAVVEDHVEKTQLRVNSQVYSVRIRGEAARQGESGINLAHHALSLRVGDVDSALNDIKCVGCWINHRLARLGNEAQGAVSLAINDLDALSVGIADVDPMADIVNRQGTATRDNSQLFVVGTVEDVELIGAIGDV